jgi:hypothetical protein
MPQKFLFTALFMFVFYSINAQNITQNIGSTGIYSFIDELANEGIIEVNSAIKPYNRNFIAKKLVEAEQNPNLLNKRQMREIVFYKQEYALDLDTLARSMVEFTDKETFSFTLLQPAFHYNNGLLKARITPMLGMNLLYNKKGVIREQKWGAEFQMTIANHVSVWGSMQEMKFAGNLKDGIFPNKQLGALLYPSTQLLGMDKTRPFGYEIDFLYNHFGYQYDLNNHYGGDFTESRGGIVAYTSWGSIGLVKDNIVWGDNYNGSIIFSGRVPSFPMITLNIKPCRWFELNYIHGFLVSNVIDSTNYYSETQKDGTFDKKYRYKNKFIAANFMTFSPIPKFDLSIGNSIIYAERNMNAWYLIPIAFYKAFDKVQTRGLGNDIENQNAQIFLNISSRNIKHLHVYFSAFLDEVQFGRFLPKSKARNPMSFKIGFNAIPVKNISLIGEFTRNRIVCYKHSIEELTYESNSINLGHFLGDNSQDIFLAVNYKPVRGLNLTVSYDNQSKYNDYKFIRSNIAHIIEQKAWKDKVFSNSIIAFNADYEIINNVYANINVQYNYAKGYNTSAVDVIDKLGNITAHLLDATTAQQNLNKYSPIYYQDKNLTVTVGLNFGF